MCQDRIKLYNIIPKSPNKKDVGEILNWIRPTPTNSGSKIQTMFDR